MGESSLSLTVIQIPPPRSFLHLPLFQFMHYIMMNTIFKILFYISERLKKESQGLVGWDDPIDVNEQKRVRDLLN